MTETVFEAQDFLMNTNIEQKIFGNTPDAVYGAATEKLRELEDKMSFYREESEVGSSTLISQEEIAMEQSCVPACPWSHRE